MKECPICKHVFDDDNLPERCPDCGRPCDHEHIITTTGDLKQDYDIISPITATEDLPLNGIDFCITHCIHSLEKMCRKLGGNAVVCIQISSWYDHISEKDRVTLLGTAVKIKE